MADEIAVVGGVDTHTDFHQAAVIDSIGRHLATEAFPTSPAGYRRLLDWLRSHGDLMAVGVEGTGAYGAELARYLRANQVTVIDVDRPDRRARRANGKSDPVDAYAAATAVLSGRAGGTPKTRDGVVEAIRSLRVVRRSAIKSRTQTINQIRTLIVTAPGEVREKLRALPTGELIRQLARSRPGSDHADPACAIRTALRRLARRYQYLTEEITDADAELKPLVAQTVPDLVALPGVGTETAAQLLITAGDNPNRLRSEASFAHLCAAAPIPASSGRTHRHRLNRGGDRQANNALHTIALVRMRYDTRTKDYVIRRTAEGMSKKDILRCLKRFIAREVYKHLISSQTTPKPLLQTA
ncbi:IS110 family transposase [Streptomyces sudanensis]|uniref:IS110 family transposase n=3 Tax=Streptomyces sudanensis TaxID=436397 RepID=A0ABY4TFI1_9ACTN|nr:IS110 family transposase [Streptomyces sudanensis]URN14615.1 IS110 family transposase [Streptomyces sudanensis]URN15139.1 IS110 family transposase [Streptomyces sudanensis]URN15400.1 IS110 family transposase [Streptomyces sudanensis]URN15675.1 IS110 family transposase [Streptomyces sudanensis]URN16245.1 IS110 family transposase [Streptomyces sudanensis]